MSGSLSELNKGPMLTKGIVKVYAFTPESITGTIMAMLNFSLSKLSSNAKKDFSLNGGHLVFDGDKGLFITGCEKTGQILARLTGVRLTIEEIKISFWPSYYFIKSSNFSVGLFFF